MLAGGKHTSKIQRSESKDPHHLAALGAARLRAGVVTGPYDEGRNTQYLPDKSEFGALLQTVVRTFARPLFDSCA